MRLHLGHVITFGASGNAEDYLLYGWHFPEPLFTWASGTESALWLPKVDAPHGFFVELHVQPLIAQGGPHRQRMAISVNGTLLGKAELRAETLLAYYVPPTNWQSRRIVVNIRHPDAYGPPAANIALSMTFSRLRIFVLDEPLAHSDGRLSVFPMSREIDPSPATSIPNQEVALSFTSLGFNCEFGFVQRQLKAEPIDLLRFASIPIIRLIEGIDTGFAGIDDPDNLFPEGTQNWDIRDRKYNIAYHTFLTADDISWNDLAKRESRRLRFLADKLIRDIESGEKVFVWWQRSSAMLEEMMPLYLALRRRGPSTLLWVEQGEHRQHFIDEVRPGLLRATISSFTPPGNHNMPGASEKWLPILSGTRRAIIDKELSRNDIPSRPARAPKVASGSIFFLGNCQAHALLVAYELFAKQELGYEGRFIDWRHASDSELELLKHADVVVLQVADLCREVPNYVPSHARLILFPYVSGGFLWPFASEPHIHFVNTRMGGFGAFGETGDAFLNRMIAGGVSAEEALERYVSMDIVARTNPDRRLEIALDRQSRRDGIAGIDVATYIHRTFRHEPLFLQRGHLGPRLFRFVASEVFRKLGLSEERLNRLSQPSLQDFYEPCEHPIHPKIAAHFGLSYGHSGHKFRIHHGRLTFEEYCIAYMNEEYNEPIQEGLRLLHRSNDLAAAANALEQGVRACPDSVAGLLGLADAYERLGDTTRSRLLLEQAAAIEPVDAKALAALADHCLRAGDIEKCEALVHKILIDQPGHSHGMHLARVVEARRHSL